MLGTTNGKRDVTKPIATSVGTTQRRVELGFGADDDAATVVLPPRNVVVADLASPRLHMVYGVWVYSLVNNKQVRQSFFFLLE